MAKKKQVKNKPKAVKPEVTKITPQTMTAAKKLVELQNAQVLKQCSKEISQVLEKYGCALNTSVVVEMK